jgi:hypothetical protein
MTHAIIEIWVYYVRKGTQVYYKDYVLNYEELLEKSKMPSLKVRRLRSIAIKTFKIIHKVSLFSKY